MKNMINFTVGPVQSSEEVRKIGSEQVPYFRTPEFSNLMLENEKLMKEFTKASEDDKVVFITGSGTASMETVVMNLLNEDDKAIVVNGGSFGQRFADLCDLHNIKNDQIKLDFGKALTKEMLKEYDNKNYTAFLVNIHETSSGVHYDLNMISDFCKKNNLFLIVDAISSFLADEIDFSGCNIGAMVTGSQKALACPPGISIIVLSEEALKRVENNKCKCMYFDLKSALKNAERGQTPFTPAVGTLIQINARLNEIKAQGGVESEIKRIKGLAMYFREAIKSLPFEVISESPSNAVTCLHPITCSAKKIFDVLKDEYNIWVCPNGGEKADIVFRVGHIGYLNTSDYDKLIAAFKDLKNRNII